MFILFNYKGNPRPIVVTEWVRRQLSNIQLLFSQICVSVIRCLSDWNLLRKMITRQLLKIRDNFQLLLELLIIYLGCPLYNRPCQYQSDVVIEILWDLMIWSQNMQNFCVKFSIDSFVFLSWCQCFDKPLEVAGINVMKEQSKIINKPSLIDDPPAQRKHSNSPELMLSSSKSKSDISSACLAWLGFVDSTVRTPPRYVSPIMKLQSGVGGRRQGESMFVLVLLSCSSDVCSQPPCHWLTDWVV